jgi:glycosyltransferase involved in cell wall biosynthesis
MKILHLLTYDNYGGAARAAYRQHRALLAAGENSRMLVRQKFTNDQTVKIYTGNHSWVNRAKRTLRRAWISRLEKKSRAMGIGGLTDPRADLLRYVPREMLESDVINLHKTERFADLPAILAALPAKKPVVITVHDLSPVTGGCDYPSQCNKFAEACGQCPLLGTAKLNDYSQKIFRLRQAAYATRDPQHFAFVSVSKWTAEVARRSALTQNFRVEIIHNGIDQSVFSPEKRDAARLALGIGAGETTLCFSAHDVSISRKGYKHLKEALELLSKNSNLHLLTMGSGHVDLPSGCRHTHFGKIESDELLALIYRAANVFVIPSIEEAFGQTALEAVSCGTLVAGFRTGGIPEIVIDGVNGLLVETGDSAALGKAISQLVESEDLQRQWVQGATMWVASRFSYSCNAAAYKKIYNQLLEGTL